MLYIYILLFILLISLGYIYFSYKLRREKKVDDTPKNIHKTIEEAHKKKNDINNILKNKGSNLSSKYIDQITTVYSSKPKLPYTSSDPFKETENIHLIDFITFQGSSILLVEDNLITQKIILSTLNKSGINISIANNGKEALDLLFTQKKEFDLVLMDINMPIMDGYTATQKIRENQQFDSMPIVTFTAFTLGEEINTMFDLGSNAYITKPLNIGQLYTVFNTYLVDNYRQISLLESIKIDGLDIKHGITMADDDEAAYKQSLREFTLLYKSMIHTMPRWIDENESDRILSACMNMGDILKYIGAYELQDIVFRMKKIYIYNTEHRIEEFQEIFPKKLEKLIKAIERYLTANPLFTNISLKSR
jgi:CheY-like chemotaxis protein